MDSKEYEKAASYWDGKNGLKMPVEEIKKRADDYIKKNSTCALATGYGDFVR